MPDLRSPFAADFTAHDAVRLAGVFKALAEPTRLQILGLLNAGQTNATAIHEALGAQRYPTVLHHVNVLAAAGLVVSARRRGKRGVDVIDRELDRDALAEVAGLLHPAGAR